MTNSGQIANPTTLQIGTAEIECINSPINPLPIATWNQLRRMAIYGQHEACGFIDSRFEIHSVRNVHIDPAKNFYMDFAEVRKTIERIVSANCHVLGVFHTHPSGNPLPSEGDIVGWPNPDLKWRYWVAVPHDVYEYRYANQPSRPYGGLAKYGQ